MVRLVPFSEMEVSSLQKSATFKAQPKLGEFDYWIQFIGLVGSFAGLCFDDSSIAIEFIQSKVRRRHVKVALFCLKLIIFFLGLAFCGYLCLRVSLDHKAERDNPTIKEEKARNLVKPKFVHFVVCLSIAKYVGQRYEFKTMAEIERATDRALDDVLEGIYTNYRGKLSYRTNYRVHPAVLFKHLLVEYGKYYGRCFSMSIQPNYQPTPSKPELIIRFKEKYPAYESYLLSENESLNGESFKYFGEYAFQKRMLKRKTNCIDYAERYENCTSRRHCVERCSIRRFFDKYQKIFFGHPVIERDLFSETEWNSTHLVWIPYANRSIYDELREKCLEEIPNENLCLESEFKETVEIVKQDYEIGIDLQFDVVLSVEEDRPSWYKLALFRDYCAQYPADDRSLRSDNHENEEKETCTRSHLPALLVWRQLAHLPDLPADRQRRAGPYRTLRADQPGANARFGVLSSNRREANR